MKRIFNLITAPGKKGISLLKELGGLFKKPKEGAPIPKGRGIVIAIGVTLFCIFMLYITSRPPAPKKQPAGKPTTPREVPIATRGGDAFISELDEKVLIKKMEQEDYRIQREIDSMKKDVASIKKDVGRLTKIQEKVVENFNKMDEVISQKIIKALRSEIAAGREVYSEAKGSRSEEAFEMPYANVPLEVYEVAPLKPISERKAGGDVYLPIGSFVKGTLLSGVYAPIDEATPLPVLISIDQAFYGPNNSKIPLEGALSIGRATGNATSERAHIQVSKMSVVMPDGKVFEKEGNLGFIVGADDSALALKGKLITKTKEQIEASFYSGVFAGAGAALERGQITQYTGSFGQTTTAEKANALQIGGAGFRQAFSRMADYQIRQLEKMVDAIYIAPGREVYIVMSEGVKIEGMQISSEAGSGSGRYTD